MILTGPEIRRQVELGAIEIDPFDPSRHNPNSDNLRLDTSFATYLLGDGVLDSKEPNPTEVQEVSPWEGIVLRPGVLYLAHTVERTFTPKHVPLLEGRSSLARLGVNVHQTGGVGDVGFNGQWVLELSVVHPVRVYPGTAVCQVMFLEPSGDLQAYAGRYQHQSGPVGCRLWKDFIPAP